MSLHCIHDSVAADAASMKSVLLCSRSRIANVDATVKNRAMSRTNISLILIAGFLAAVPMHGQDNVEAIVAQNVRPLLPQNGRGGGVAVAVRMDGRTQFFNYGFANLGRNERVTADSIFNLG